MKNFDFCFFVGSAKSPYSLLLTQPPAAITFSYHTGPQKRHSHCRWHNFKSFLGLP